MKKLYYTALFLILSFPLILNAQDYKRLTNLPHIYIETFNRVSITSKTTYVYADMHYVDEEDNVTLYDSLEIRGRGNSTWNLSKKPYRIKFKQKEKFLGTGYAKARKWTLMANAGDKTLMRNAVTSLMGEFVGLKNTPAHRFVDLTLNGKYIGNYMISDQVEVRPHRVNITEQDVPLTADSDITGGYLLEVDGFQDGNCFNTSTYYVPVRIHYPDDEDIESSQNQYIRNYINSFEKTLASSSFADPEEGYRPLVDSVSLANWFIATEVSGNIDGYYSTYFYKDKQDPRLFWGPLWDYDIAYANDNRKGDTSRQLMTDVGYGQTRNWMNRMWEDPWFASLVNRRYAEVLDEGLEDFLYQQIDSISQLIYASQQLNYQKWGINTRMLRERVLYSSYDQYVTDLKSYIKVHIPYLKTAFANKKPAEPTPAFVADNYWYRIVNAGTSTSIDVYNRNGVSGDKVCSRLSLSDQETQNWKIVPVGNYFMIINRNGNLALNDPTVGECTATTNTGTQLNAVTPDETDKHQLWTITPQGTAGYYNLTNLSTQHTANLNGGNSTDGTAIMSYNTDSRNSISNNRLWYIYAEEEINDPSAIAYIEPEEYALAYNPTNHTLHFGAENPEQLTFTAKIYNTNGTLLRTFRASETCSVSELPHGIYIIMWTVDGHRRSTKMLKE